MVMCGEGRKGTLGGGGWWNISLSWCNISLSWCNISLSWWNISPPSLQGDIRRPREGSTGVWDSLHPPEATYNIHILHENRKVSKLVREQRSRFFKYGVRYRIFRRFFLAFFIFFKDTFSKAKFLKKVSRLPLHREAAAAGAAAAAAAI